MEYTIVELASHYEDHQGGQECDFKQEKKKCPLSETVILVHVKSGKRFNMRVSDILDHLSAFAEGVDW